MVSRREEVEDFDHPWLISMRTQKTGIARPGRGVAPEHQDALRLPIREVVSEVFAETGARRIGDHQGFPREVSCVGNECLCSGTDDDSRPGEISAGGPRRIAVRFNQGQVTLGRKTSRSGQIPDPCVEVEDRYRIAANKLRHAAEQGTDEVAIALEKRNQWAPRAESAARF